MANKRITKAGLCKAASHFLDILHPEDTKSLGKILTPVMMKGREHHYKNLFADMESRLFIFVDEYCNFEPEPKYLQKSGHRTHSNSDFGDYPSDEEISEFDREHVEEWDEDEAWVD